MSDEELTVDAGRVAKVGGYNITGIYVRARLGDQWGSYDCALLDLPSLRRWLASKDPQVTIGLIEVLLGWV